MLFLAPVSYYHHHHHHYYYYYYFVIRFAEYRNWKLEKFRRYENTFVRERVYLYKLGINSKNKTCSAMDSPGIIVVQKFIEFVRGHFSIFDVSNFPPRVPWNGWFRDEEGNGTAVVEKQMLSPEDNKLSRGEDAKRSLLDRDSGREKEAVFLLPVDCAPTTRSFLTLSTVHTRAIYYIRSTIHFAPRSTKQRREKSTSMDRLD